MVNSIFYVISGTFILISITVAIVPYTVCKKPTTGIEPVNLILTKDVLYQLSYMGM